MRNRFRPAALPLVLLATLLTVSTACSATAGSTGLTPTTATSAANGGPTSTASASTTAIDTSTASPQSSIMVLPPTPSAAPSTPEAAASPTVDPTPPAPTSIAVPVVTKTVTVTPPAANPPATSKAVSPPAATSKAAPPATGGSLAGKVVVIDPGHNGRNSQHPEIINKLVPAGFGKTKPCNTTGTETNAGFPEYRFNWQTAQYLQADLTAAGATVVMTRDSDDGVGPCVNVRAQIGNDANADAVISIHGDGESAGVRGFYVMTSAQKPASDDIFARSLALAGAVRDGLAGQGLPKSNTLGSGGLWVRSDLAGLNLSVRPTVMIECGNMRNATEAALMSSEAGQREYARGIAAGVIAYLGG